MCMMYFQKLFSKDGRVQSMFQGKGGSFKNWIIIHSPKLKNLRRSPKNYRTAQNIYKCNKASFNRPTQAS